MSEDDLTNWRPAPSYADSSFWVHESGEEYVAVIPTAGGDYKLVAGNFEDELVGIERFSTRGEACVAAVNHIRDRGRVMR